MGNEQADSNVTLLLVERNCFSAELYVYRLVLSLSAVTCAQPNCFCPTGAHLRSQIWNA